MTSWHAIILKAEDIFDLIADEDDSEDEEDTLFLFILIHSSKCLLF